MTTTTGKRPDVAPLPLGFGVQVEPDTQQLDQRTLFGGSPARALRLSPAGAAAWQELHTGPIETRATGLLARRLSDAGLVQPIPPPVSGSLDVTVLIPIRDRAAMLDRCLAALGARYPVVVVDDASIQPKEVAAVVARHGARLLTRPVNGGPGPARDTGLAHITTEFVAFLDSDCVPPPDWIEQLAAHFADPAVAAIAPRIVALPSAAAANRCSVLTGGLDLGDRAARVVPGSRVSYVPTAALLIRRTALLECATPEGWVFDHAMRWGEDVDLVWRLHEAGWRIRYHPAVQIQHEEPKTWPALLTRRYHYGTTAAPLARRHPAAMAPLVLHPWPTITVAALLARRPAVAAAAFAASVLSMRRILHHAGLPTRGVLAPMATAVQQTWLGTGRYATQYGAPLLLAAALRPPRRERRSGDRLALASLLLGPVLTAWWSQRRTQRLPRYLAARLADDTAYGAGVWAGAISHRTLRPLLPRISWRPFRIASQER